MSFRASLFENLSQSLSLFLQQIHGGQPILNVASDDLLAFLNLLENGASNRSLTFGGVFRQNNLSPRRKISAFDDES